MRCLLVYPEFKADSFWSLRETCELLGVRRTSAPLGLITVAALLPPDWEVRLVDTNVEPWSEDHLAWADLVFVGGMIVQQRGTLEIVRAARRHGRPVVVGGPDATSSPHVYAEADHLVLGEAEVTLPRFLADFAAGSAAPLYADAAKADMTASPLPRFDLLDFSHYLYVGVQRTRGCPFQCEFCDIIELYGRVPRAKTDDQVLRELQAIHDLGYRGHLDFVDDNFIGDRRLLKVFLARLGAWLEERGHPFEFSTEASINLADDDDLLDLMQEVGFFSVFVGIESPDEETLKATRKRQNTHRSIADSVRKIHEHGILVNAGYIVGFDTERSSVARGIIECVEATSIPVNMVGLLYALPNTQLTRRLAAEGRLHADHEVHGEGQGGDQCTEGLNFDTRRPRGEILRDYLHVVETIYTPEAYFERVRRVGLMLDSSRRRHKHACSHRRGEIATFLRLVWRLGLARATRRPFWRTLLSALRHNPRSAKYVVSWMAIYLHMGPYARHVAERTRAAIRAEEQGRRTREPAGAGHRLPP
jgi:radical SAM superfamily enzyme YgiQ (UPF0313 family)